ncbi:MAG TPA: flagellar basal body-associated FliL family protein [Gaiellaceae bacterium]|nr:flagellar basal body-associated FliL family protein [Gaiellaceae bacterium]
MKKKLMILVPVLLLVAAGGSYEMVLKPKPKPVVKKIDGSLVSLGDPFTLNLASGHYGRVTVSVVVAPTALPAAEGTDAVSLPENDALRAIVTDDLTGIASSRLIDRTARHAVEATVLKDLKKSTDEPITQVLFTDIAVQ